MVHGAPPPMNAGTTARVMITIARMAQQLQQNQKDYWATQLALFVYGDHPEWVQVKQDLTLDEWQRLDLDLNKAIGITLGRFLYGIIGATGYCTRTHAAGQPQSCMAH